MAILWCGGEDIDFPNGAAVGVDTASTNRRSAWARCSICCSSASATYARSANFPGGSITSGWLRFYMAGTAVSSLLGLGLIKDSTSNAGLWVGTSSGASNKLALWKFDGTTKTQLVAESGVSGGSSAFNRIDLQLINYGASATVNVYFNGVLQLTYSGDVTVTGVTSVSAVGIGGASGSNTLISEIIVSDVDTRSLPGLATLALTGAGTTNAWTNTTFSNINGTTASDLNPTSSNANGQNNQYNVTDLPSGTYDVLAVKVSMRSAVSATPSVTKVKMGYNSGGSVAFGTGSTKTPLTTYSSFEQLDATNPVTSSAFVQSEMNALQLNFQSAT